VDAHTFTKQAKKFKQTLSVCQKADGKCFLGQERSAPKEFRRTIQNKRWRMLTSGVVLLHDNVCLYTAARTWAFLLWAVWPPSLQPWSSSEWLPPVYLSEELVGMTAIRQQWADEKRQNMADLTGGRLLWHRHTKTCPWYKCFNFSSEYTEKQLKCINIFCI
jgi:hypothetical protein